MTTTIGVKSGFNLPNWRPLSPSLTSFAVGLGLCQDLRNNEDRHPEVIQLASAAALNAYNIKTDGWQVRNAVSIAMGGTLGAGNATEFAPHRGPRGLVTGYATGGTPAFYRVVLGGSSDPAINISWAANQLANRGDGRGFKIRIIGNSAGGGGKISEHVILGNTAGTTPTVYLDGAPSFTPQNGDSYEILSGSVMVILGGAAAANDCKTFEIASQTTQSMAQKPAASGTDSALCCLDEHYVPYDRSPGEGLLGVMTATATAAGTLTGQAANTGNVGDAGVAANEFRNFQIRIVEDTGAPTAVNQRRSISSHTAGTSPVYTLGAVWTVTPSANAKYVIENPNWWLWQPQNATVCYIYREIGYSPSGDDLWNATLLTGRGAVAGAGVTLIPSFGMQQNNQIATADAATRPARYSQVHSFRGGGVGTIDILDIAAQSITATTIDVRGATFTTGNSYVYCPQCCEGRFAYLNAAGQSSNYRYDVKNRVLTQWTAIPVSLGTMVVGQRMAVALFVDGSVKINRVMMLAVGAVGLFDIMVTGY